MDIEPNSLDQTSLLPETLKSSLSLRAKTSLRLKYEAESQMILKKFGGLSGIQSKLGLSQRKICKLLMVDPSSWSRWVLNESKTPPHILRACEWYLALMDKYPGFDVNFWLHSQGKTSSATLEKASELQKDFALESAELKIQVKLLEKQISELRLSVDRSQNRPSRMSPASRTFYLFGGFVITFFVLFFLKLIFKLSL